MNSGPQKHKKSLKKRAAHLFHFHKPQSGKNLSENNLSIKIKQSDSNKVEQLIVQVCIGEYENFQEYLLKNNTKALGLSSFSLNNDNIAHLIKALAGTNITHLDLSKNDFDHKILHHLKYLKHTAITHLTLSHNFMYQCALSEIIQSLEGTKILYLNVLQCKLRPSINWKTGTRNAYDALDFWFTLSITSLIEVKHDCELEQTLMTKGLEANKNKLDIFRFWTLKQLQTLPTSQKPSLKNDPCTIFTSILPEVQNHILGFFTLLNRQYVNKTRNREDTIVTEFSKLQIKQKI